MITGIFCYRLRSDVDLEEYQAQAFRMFERVTGNPDFGLIDLKNLAGADGETVLLAQFASPEGIKAWRNDPEHLIIQERGRTEWFESYWGGEVIPRYTFDRESGRKDTPAQAAP